MTPASNAIDARAIHRTLTGLRDRLRLQEDELDRLRETMPTVERQLSEAFSAIGRTDASMRRLVAQVDRLLEEVSRRPQAAPHTIEMAAKPFEAAPRLSWRIPLITLAVLIASLVACWYFFLRDAPNA